MMAFWLERFVGLGARDAHLVPGQKLNESAPVRGSKIFIIHRVSSLALVDQPLTINKVRCRKLLKCICSLHWHTFATRLCSSRANHTPIRSHPGPSSPSIGSVRFPFLVRFEAQDSTTWRKSPCSPTARTLPQRDTTL